MQVAKNRVVLIDFTLTNKVGTVLDHTESGEPLAYLHGAGNIIPGVEEALEGKKSGDELLVVLEPEKAYGIYDDALLQECSRDMFDAKMEIIPGMRFEAQNEEGETQIVTVLSVEDDTITIDANHPYAGEELNVRVKVVDVREASETELEHGHVHGRPKYPH